MGTPQKWTSTEEPPVSLVRRTWRRLVKRTIRIFYIQGDTLAQVSKRIAAFVVGWGCFIGLLTWAGYRNGYLHGVDDGILSVCILFALALLTAPGYLGSRRERDGESLLSRTAPCPGVLGHPGGQREQ